MTPKDDTLSQEQLQPAVPTSRKERLMNFAVRSTHLLANEFNKLYSPQTETSPTRALKKEESYTDLKRTDTHEIDDILQSEAPDAVLPHCMLYPTYACQTTVDDKIKWKVQLGGWVYAIPGSGRIERLLLAVGRTYGGLMANSDEDHHFVNMVNQFRCQTMRDIEVHIRLGKAIQSAEKLIHEHEIKKQEGILSTMINSGASGRFQDTWLIESPDIEKTISREILELEARFDGIDTPNTGLVDLIGDTGISVISDIDDTIKITDVLDGRDAILRNTFFKKAREVPGMSEVYRAWDKQGVHFHYVSNSPWQIYPTLRDFFYSVCFPQGSMHLRFINTQDIIHGKPMQHKLAVIPPIIRDFPNRKFILVGDSGEFDPEVYQEIYRQFPDQIIKIFIHDVSSERAMNADKTREASASEKYYTILRKFVTREHSLLKRTNTSPQTAMDAITDTEVPQEQKIAMDPNVSENTKLEIFEERMKRVSTGMREGVFHVFKFASQLLLDPVVTEELLILKSGEHGV